MAGYRHLADRPWIADHRQLRPTSCRWAGAPSDRSTRIPAYEATTVRPAAMRRVLPDVGWKAAAHDVGFQPDLVSSEAPINDHFQPEGCYASIGVNLLDNQVSNLRLQIAIKRRGKKKPKRNQLQSSRCFPRSIAGIPFT